MPLPVNIDTTYADDATQPGVKLHQQHHDTIHAFVNDHPADGHTAAEVSFSPTGTIAATTVQAAIEEAADSPAFIGVLLASNGTQSISTGSPTIVTFATETYDGLGFHEGANPSRITVPAGKAGYYHVVTCLKWDTSGTGARLAEFLVNGATQPGYQTQVAAVTSVGEWTTQELVAPVSLAVGDYIEVRCSQSSGGNLVLQSGCRFAAWRIGV